MVHWPAKSLSSLPFGKTFNWQLMSALSHHPTHVSHLFSPLRALPPCFKSPWTPAGIISLLPRVAPCVCPCSPPACHYHSCQKDHLKTKSDYVPKSSCLTKRKAKSWHWCKDGQAQSLSELISTTLFAVQGIYSVFLWFDCFPPENHVLTTCPCLIRVFTHFLLYYLWWLISCVDLARLGAQLLIKHQLRSCCKDIF